MITHELKVLLAHTISILLALFCPLGGMGVRGGAFAGQFTS
jgi:hypothetical protein